MIEATGMQCEREQQQKNDAVSISKREAFAACVAADAGANAEDRQYDAENQSTTYI